MQSLSVIFLEPFGPTRSPWSWASRRSRHFSWSWAFSTCFRGVISIGYLPGTFVPRGHDRFSIKQDGVGGLVGFAQTKPEHLFKIPHSQLLLLLLLLPRGDLFSALPICPRRRHVHPGRRRRDLPAPASGKVRWAHSSPPTSRRLGQRSGTNPSNSKKSKSQRHYLCLLVPVWSSG
jgi:hypothetical protein